MKAKNKNSPQARRCDTGGLRFHQKKRFSCCPPSPKTTKTSTLLLHLRGFGGFGGFAGWGIVHFSIWRGSSSQLKGRCGPWEPTVAVASNLRGWCSATTLKLRVVRDSPGFSGLFECKDTWSLFHEIEGAGNFTQGASNMTQGVALDSTYTPVAKVAKALSRWDFCYFCYFCGGA